MTNKTRAFQLTGIFLILIAVFMALVVQAFAAPADASTSSATDVSTGSATDASISPVTAAQTDPEPVEPTEDEADFDNEYDPFHIAADLIGMDVDALWEAIDNGQTIAAVATANDIDPQTIIDALVADERAFIDELVAEGEISVEEAAEWLAEVDSYAAEFVNEPVDFEEFEDGYDPFPAIVELLGIDEDALWTALDDGQSLASVAQANGVDPEAVVGLLVEQEKAFIDELVAEGDISDEEAAEWLTEVEAYASEFVNELFAWEELEYDEFDEVYFVDEAVLELLGIGEDALWEAFENGQTLADIAQANGVAPEAVIALLVEQENAFIDELLADGEISEDEAVEWRADVETYIAELVNEPIAFEELEYEDDYLAPVAELLGMDEDAVWDALESGQTLAQLAEAQGVDVQALKDVLIASENELIDEMLADGEISEEEAAEWRSFLAEDIDFWVNESWEIEYDDMDWDDAEFEDFDEDESE